MKPKREKIPTFRQVTVPSGSKWQCVKCEVTLEPGSICAKGGRIVICADCIRKSVKEMTHE